MARIALLFFAFVAPFVAPAQEWELGVQGGASGYMGDLNPENPAAFNDWSAGLFVKYNFNHTLGLRGNFAYANASAYDFQSSVPQRKNRWLGFYNPVMEASLLVDFNFFKWLPQRGRVVYTPYIFAGIGGIVFEPKRTTRPSSGGPSEEVYLRDYMTEGVAYNNRAISIPFGAGFKYNLRGPFSIGVELGYRLALTDYLDDVSGDYFDYNTFGSQKPNSTDSYPKRPPFTQDNWEQIANPSDAPVNSQRGDGRPYDSFMTVGITLSYTIFKGGCPEWQ